MSVYRTIGPLVFYSKTGVYRGIHYFLIFALKHRLWVLVRTASVYPQSVLSKNMKIVKKIQPKIVIFTAVKNGCMLHGCVFMMHSSRYSLEAIAQALLMSTYNLSFNGEISKVICQLSQNTQFN